MSVSQKINNVGIIVFRIINFKGELKYGIQSIYRARRYLDRYYPPKGEFVRFESEEHYIQKGQEWGLFDKTLKNSSYINVMGKRIT